MRAINTFILETLFFIILLMALIILIMGSYYVLITMVKELFGYKLDLFKRRKNDNNSKTTK